MEREASERGPIGPQQSGVVQEFGKRSPLAFGQFRDLWTTRAVSNIGSQVQVVGAAWLMASLTNSPQLVALVQTAINLPTVFVVLAGGALADNYDRRVIMLVTQTAMLMLAVTLAVLTWLHLVTPLSLLVFTLGIAAFNALNNPGWQAAVRDILPREMISRAVALNSISINLARTVGPAVGGLILAAAGATAAFVFNAISFVGFIIVLARWRPLAIRRSTPRERIAPAMIAGIRYAALAPHVRNAICRGGLSGISASAAFALLPVLARQVMGGSALLYGLLLGAFGLGSVVGAWTAARLRGGFSPDQVVGYAVTAMSLGLVVLAWSPNAIVAGLGAALCGLGWVGAHTTYNTTVQLASPVWVTARSLALYQTTTFAGMAAGSAFFGWMAEHVGVAQAFLAAGAAQASAGLLGIFQPLPRLEDIQVEPLGRWREPKLGVEIDANDGPILVQLEYKIEPENTARFIETMKVRRRIRTRDGALDWRLVKCLNDGTLWTECYSVPSWAEYLRHNDRRTVADVENADVLRSLNANVEGPRVRRYLGHRIG